MAEEESRAPAGRRSPGVGVVVPFLVFVALAAVFAYAIYRQADGYDNKTLPSVLLSHPAPETRLPPVAGLTTPGIDSAEFSGKVTLVNVWASWCVPCRDEHPTLMQLGKDSRYRLVGINYKDSPQNAANFLGSLGNPFAAVGSDENGRAGINWGVYGVPETFVVGKDGKIAYKHVGPLTPESVQQTLMPEIDKAIAAGQ